MNPVEVTDLQLAFPSDALDRMPSMEEIPDEFKRFANTWCQFQRNWFFYGLDPETQFQPREGIDPAVAVRHLASIQGSYEPKHEHKEAAVAYLASLWFVRVISADKVYGEPE